MKWVTFGINLVPKILLAIRAVERIATLIGVKGRDKEDAALQIVTTALEAAEGIIDRDLLEDERVAEAARQFIRSYVALQNAIAAAKAARVR